MTLDFAAAPASEIQGIRNSKSSKYNELVEACMSLTPGNALRIPFPEGADPAKLRINVANAVRGKVMGAWAAQGLNYSLRVVRGDGYIGIVCKEETEDAPAAEPKAKAKGKKK